MRYEHTQKVPTTTLAPLTAVGIIAGLLVPGAMARLAVVGALGFAAATFRCLTITIENGEVLLSFGDGLFKKPIPLDKVTSCKAIRTKPISGWGIHWLGNGWLYNIYGLDAVELTAADGGITQIGTDDPEQLASAINEEIESLTANAARS